MTSHAAANQLATDIFMRRERRKATGASIFGRRSSPTGPLIEERVWTKHATGLPYQALYRRLFLQEYTEESRWLENSYKGPDAHWIWQQWKRCRTWFAEQTTAQFPSQWVSTLCLKDWIRWMCCLGSCICTHGLGAVAFTVLRCDLIH